ncbi:pyridoxamine 5'-phosphate oxidase [Lactarius hatsudake]|nr:pyridoxamine 5'-phosphate oxidase [Lactarius hatsudake]
MDAIIQSSPNKLSVLAHQQYDSPENISPFDVPSNPFDLFRQWFTSVQGTVNQPEAMALSTASPEGIPSTRIVLLKEVDSRGFVFFTNYDSRKSREMAANPYASLALYWREVHRQVRAVGRVEKVSKEESEAYFRSRPLGSRIGAWASNQSSVIGEGELDRKIKDIEKRFALKEGDTEAEVPLPDHWGGWRIVPSEVEFWVGKPSRLHDRVRYLLHSEGSPSDPPVWKIDRLSP